MVRGLAAREQVSLELRSVDASGVGFVARDSYRADGAGVVDLARSAPLAGGSYSGVAAMGLLFSMSAPNAAPLTEYTWGSRPHRFVLTVSARGHLLGTVKFVRRWRVGAYRDVALAVVGDGINGSYSAPLHVRARPAVLVLGGSEGGNAASGFPQRFAADGLPTLEVGYFHGRGLPDRLVDIPLEYFRKALVWLSRQPEVDPRRISVLGISYGSEAALLLGVHYPTLVHQVAALVPSNVVTCGILGAHRPSGCLGSPWSLNGKPLPYTKLLRVAAPWDNPSAEIPVELIRGRVFLVCGQADEVWSSCPYAHAIVERRTRQHEPTTLYDFPGATHSVGTPFIDEPGVLGNELFPATETDREHYYQPLLNFLHER